MFKNLSLETASLEMASEKLKLQKGKKMSISNFAEIRGHSTSGYETSKMQGKRIYSLISHK